MEFRPLVTDLSSVPGVVVLLGGGVLLLVPFLLGAGRLGRADLVLAVWAVTTLAGALARARFAVVAAPLLALVAGRVLARLAARRERAPAAVAVLLALLPLLGTRGSLTENEVRPAHVEPVLRAAAFLRERCGVSERVLAPWSWGHLLNRFGECPVLVDGFGSMPDRGAFEAALEATLATREERLVRFCRERSVRWIVLTNPLFQLAGTAGEAGYPSQAYLATASDGAPRVTRLAQSTVWWRAYFPDRPGPPGAVPSSVLRRVWSDPQPSWEPDPFRGPAIVILEVPPGVPVP